MKLLTIRLQNLNSLSGGVQEVRLDAPPLSNAGLFLITGATGAGKSTLLDAITLALYGRAARYGSEKPDEMMSRHSAESLAEVEFEAGGRRLRATWRLRRARGKAGGNLQPVERRLADALTGEFLAEKAGEVDALVEKLTGLDLDRFQRSVLLAQGQFAAFLKAKPKERAELLEKITGTEIYSELSMLAHELWKQKDAAVLLLKERLGALVVLTEAERSALEARYQEAQVSAEQALQEKDAAARCLAERRASMAKQAELAQLRTALAKAATDEIALKARQAGEREAVKQAAALLKEAKAQLAARQPVWDHAAGLVVKSAERERLLEEGRARYKSLDAQCKEALGQMQQAGKALADHDARAETVEAWLKQHGTDAALAGKAAELRTAILAWRPVFAALTEGRRKFEEAASLDKGRVLDAEQAVKMQGELDEIRVRQKQLREEVQKAQMTCEQQRTVVENAQLVAGCEELREELTPGQPCPVCGSAEHPFASGQLNFASQLKAAKALLTTAETRLQTLVKDSAQTDNAVTKLETQRQAVVARCADAEVRLKSLQAPDETALASLVAAEKQNRVTLTNATDPDAAEAMVNAMEQQARVFAQRQAEAVELRGRRLKLEGELSLVAQTVEATGRHLGELQEKGKALRSEADALKEELKVLLDGNTLEADRSAFEQRVMQTEEKVREAESSVIESGKTEVALRGQRESIESRRDALTKELADAEVATAEAVAALELREAGLAEAAKTKTEWVGDLRRQVLADDEARAKREAGGETLRVAEAEAARWGRLKELIGSADGSKFARFAQSLSLRQLLSVANRHLEALAPRYRLTAVEGEGLDMRIVDLYQADVERPMESLSGGESFLASLALALGLSKLASRQHPIDSLFIDEGFGTLDSETLEVALSALENLRADGKMIGLISHVELLKERLAAQVRVVRTQAGVSRVEVVD